jgi:toxin-antitoxin system PIN domain toxin
VLLAFLRVTTRPALFRSPLPTKTAFDIIESWLEQPLVAVIHPGPRHIALMRELLLPSGAAGNLTSDAHLAAMAIEHGAELCTSNRDFARFPRLKCRNPLA